MRKIFFISLIVLLVFGFGHWQVTSNYKSELRFSIVKNATARELSENLKNKGAIRHADLFLFYLKIRGLDTKLQAGDYVVLPPLSFAKIATALQNPGISERTITILPGWNNTDIANYLDKIGVASSTLVLDQIGRPAKANANSLEGYLAPETYRIYKAASLDDVIAKLKNQRTKELTPEILAEIKNQGKTVHEVLTLASIVEREGRTVEDKKKIADIFWRRLAQNWALQSDATVHYIFGTPANVFTTDEQRQSQNPYNTYQFRGLPPGPICAPSRESIDAVIHPTPNDNWYFLTTLDTGKVIYSKTIDEQTKNVLRYLR